MILDGPFPTRVTCTLGQPCPVELTGIDLAAHNGLLITSRGTQPRSPALEMMVEGGWKSVWLLSM